MLAISLIWTGVSKLIWTTFVSLSLRPSNKWLAAKKRVGYPTVPALKILLFTFQSTSYSNKRKC